MHSVILPRPTSPPSGAPAFTSPDLFAWLEAATDEDLDTLPFGIIAMDPGFMVTSYSATEANYSSLTQSRAIGRHCFTSVAPCINNFMVAHRFEAEPEIDAILDYVFTFRMAPQKVRLRMLKRPGGRRMYLAVEWHR